MPRVRSHCGGFAQTNGYLIESTGGTKVVVDAPGGMVDWLDGQGIVPDAILLTHAHFDHVIDAAALKRRFGCPLKAFAIPNPDLTLESAYQDLNVRIEAYPVDEQLVGGSRVSVGDLTLECFHVPGHSPDSICFFLAPSTSDERPLLFGGDVLFQGSIGRTDFPHGDHDGLIRGIREKLFALPDATVVFPGHGGKTTIGVEKVSNPYARLNR